MNKREINKLLSEIAGDLYGEFNLFHDYRISMKEARIIVLARLTGDYSKAKETRIYIKRGAQYCYFLELLEREVTKRGIC